MKKEQSMNRAARRPQLGSWHTITEKAEKIRHKNTETTIVQWHAFEIEPVRAMYIGYRYKFNGHLVVAEIFGGDEDWVSWGFIQDQSVEVWLFVVAGHKNPIPVFPFDYPENEDDTCLDMGEETVDEYCPKCDEKMLLTYVCDDDPFSAYYVCEDCGDD